MPRGEHERIGVGSPHLVDTRSIRSPLATRAVTRVSYSKRTPRCPAQWAARLRVNIRASPLRSPGAANRAFEILRSMMFRAEEWGLRERDNNPCLGIAKNPRNNIARFLDTGELTRLGRSLNAREVRWPEAVAAIRLLAFTGCRRSEVLNLRWRDIAAVAINLPESKTGPCAVRLCEAAQVHIEAPRRCARPRGAPVPSICTRLKATIPSDSSGGWVCTDAKLSPLRLHDLRHTVASQAVMSGENLPLVGRLLGHRRHRTTAGYAHLADGYLVEAAEKVGSIIAEAMEGLSEFTR